MKCPKCQFENQNGAKFCKDCGDSLELACLECGTTYELGSKFCDECGFDLRKSSELCHRAKANRLDKQLEKAGYTLKDLSCIIISHLHLDHAGGLECFRGIDVPVYAHEEEIKYAFYAIATKQDFGAYLPYYIDPAFNWKAVHGEEFEFFEGITLYQTQGHTPGTMSMKVTLNGSESFLFTTETMLFKENYYDEQPLGWLIRDVSEWWRSLAKLKSIATRYNSHVILGHDEEVFAEYTKKPFYGS